VTALIDISNATVLRGGTKVFDGFSLRIEQGCSTAILGPNGAGKSTLLKLVSGELHPVFTVGSHVKVLGRENWNVWDLRAHLGVVSYDLQHEYLAGTTGVNVVLSGFYSSVDIWLHQVFSHAQLRKAEETIEALGVQSLRNRAFGEMSTGEQRRFLLARALVHDPDTLLLDEPTSGLDLKSAFEHRAVLRGLMQRGITVLLITHNVQQITPEIHRVVMLKDGKVFADGSREEVLTSQTLSMLFDYPLEALWFDGTCQVFPSGETGHRDHRPADR
jgi:iron complex transport system ATP-binding protein